MPLKIIIVGAGIGGLTAAVALRQAGHKVEIFEKSAFAAEIGAALSICPNGTRVLNKLGFSFAAARAVTVEGISVMDGKTLELQAKVDMSDAEKTFGAKVWAVHRVDFHKELLSLALSKEGNQVPVRLRLSSKVVTATPDGRITLEDGTVHTADLIVAADGLKSVLRKVVTDDIAPPRHTGLSAFRFLVDTEILESDPAIMTVMEKKGTSIIGSLQDPGYTGKTRSIIWYGCRDGTIQNFAGLHASRKGDGDDEEAMKAAMFDEFKNLAPEVLRIIKHSYAAKCWPLFVHAPLTKWYNDRIVLIGDSAHPMLPLNAQGANMALEDAGALGHLFRDFDHTQSIPERLEMFQQVRANRAARVQTLSSVKLGKEMEVEEQVQRFADPPGSGVPRNMAEHISHDYGYDVYQKCDEVMAMFTNVRVPA